jgi:hypothetical protein
MTDTTNEQPQPDTPIARLRRLGFARWLVVIMVPVLIVSAALAAHFEPPARGWLFCIPYGSAILFALVSFVRRAHGWLTKDRDATPASVREEDRGFYFAVARAGGVVIAAFTLLQIINGTPDPFQIPAMFDERPCSNARANIDLDRPASARVDSSTRHLVVNVFVEAAPKRGEEYWIMTYSYSSTPQAYFAKQQLKDAEVIPGAHNGIVLVLHTPAEAVFDKRDVFVACAWTLAAHDWLVQNKLHDPDQSWNVNRRGLVDGVAVVSDKERDSELGQ